MPGRGRRRLLRSVWEAALTGLYAGDWPRRLLNRTRSAGRVEVVHETLACLPPDRPRLRIVFLSDVHVGPTTPPRTLDRAFDLAAAEQPDVLALGGDLVFLGATPARIAELCDRVDSVPARTKVAVLGNHDLWTHHDRITEALTAVGVHVLVNDALRLPPPHEDVAVLGLDDPGTGDPDPDRALSACGDAAIRLAFSHAPEGFPLLRGRGVSLVLSGHTHGGHIALSGGRPLHVPGPLGRTYLHGRFEEEGTTLLVSRGVGCVAAPLRWNAPADVVIVDVVPTG